MGDKEGKRFMAIRDHKLSMMGESFYYINWHIVIKCSVVSTPILLLVIYKHNYTDIQYAKKCILTLGKEAIILVCDIIMGKCLISMETFGNTRYNFI